EVNTDKAFDKFLSRTTLSSLTHPKAPADKKKKKKQNPLSSQLKTSKSVKKSKSKMIVIDTQFAKDSEANADATICLETSKSAKEIVNHHSQNFFRRD
nr:hypothetical protein [Tanacetum cinerariifolium]